MPAVITLCVALGYDALVGMAIVFIGGNAGYTAGIFNPFNVGVAQSIAELDAFSGSWYRWILLAVLLVVSSIGITRYAVRVKRTHAQCGIWNRQYGIVAHRAGSFG